MQPTQKSIFDFSTNFPFRIFFCCRQDVFYLRVFFSCASRKVKHGFQDRLKPRSWLCSILFSVSADPFITIILIVYSCYSAFARFLPRQAVRDRLYLFDLRDCAGFHAAEYP